MAGAPVDPVAAWRQGDVALEIDWFVLIVATDDGTADHDVVEDAVDGLVALTQTCDIVRPADKRPYVEFAPLVEVDADRYADIARGASPAYALVPALSNRRLVADLDRVMTVHKDVVRTWTRTPGWTTDGEVRDFAKALARKRARFAFPDDFVALVSKLQDRVRRKHGRASEEGEALRALDEIRVLATPSWDAPAVDLHFHFIRDVAAASPRPHGWDRWLETWLRLIPAQGRFGAVGGVVQSLDALNAREYSESDPLDLDYLSLGADDQT